MKGSFLWIALFAAIEVTGAQTTPTELDSDRHPTFHTGGEVLIRHGHLITISHGDLPDTDILISKGKISKIGKELTAPTGVKVIDAKGRFITPGIVDAHSHRASDDTNEGADSITAEVRILDVLNTKSLGLFYAVASGMTTSLILHGSANPIGGQSIVIKNKWEHPIKEAIFDGAPRMVKFALGENPKRPGQSNQRFPASRIGVEAVYRRAFNDARNYTHAWDEYQKQRENPKIAPPRRDLRLEALSDILSGKIWVQCHSYRQDEMLMMVRLSQEFHFHLCLQHALESYKIAPELAEAHIPVSMFGDGFAYKLEVVDSIPMATTICDKAGVVVSVNTDTSFGLVPLTQDAAKALRYGMSVDHAMRMLTINPAIELGVDKRVGTLDIGKDGDIAIWNGHPLSNYTKCVMTFIDGEVYFERRDAFKVDPHSLASSLPESRTFNPEKLVPLKEGSSYLIAHATVHPVSSPDLINCDVLIKNGRIANVGQHLTGGSSAVVVDGTGLDVYPGFIDAGSKLGLDEIGEVASSQDSSENGDFKADLQAITSINPDNQHFPKVRFNGITSNLSMPSGGLVAGQSTLINTNGFTTEGMTVVSRASLDIYLPSGPPAIWKSFMPADQITQMENALVERIRSLKEYLQAGQRYGEAKAAGDEIPTDIKLEALQPYLKADRPVIFHADEARGIRQAVEIAKLFKLKAIIAGGAEAWQLTTLLKDTGIPVIYKAPSDACPDEVSPPGDYDPYDAPYATPSVLKEAGVKFCFMTDSFDQSMNLPFNAGRTCAFGLAHNDAIRALTLDAATILGVGDKLGSLEKGKIANVIVTQGDPLDLNSQVRYVFIDGKPVLLKTHYTELYTKYIGRLKSRK